MTLCKSATVTGYDFELRLRYRIAFEIKKQKQNIVHARGSYTVDVPNFPRRTILIAQKMVHGVNN